MTWIVRGLALLLVLPAGPQLLAQEPSGSLAEAAAREKERRKGAKARVYREHDLAGKSPTGSEPVQAAGPSPSPSSAVSSRAREKSLDELRAEKKQAYEKRIADQVKTMETVKKAMADAQLELNDINTITKFGSRREALLKVLEDGQAELKKADQAIAEIEEEARREGVAVSRP